MEVEQMLKAAMSNSGFESYGNVNWWMAGIVISDRKICVHIAVGMRVRLLENGN
jgi:hypothetical protein